MTTSVSRVRLAVTSDVAELAALIQSAYRGVSSRAGWTTEADLLDGQRIDDEQIREIIESPRAEILVGLDSDGGTIACCQVERRSSGGIAYFGTFAVRPGRQGSGVGKRMLAYAEEHVHETWNCDAMEMTVIAQRDELIDYYRRRGYQLTGETRPFPYGDGRAGLPRRADLHFVVLRKVLDQPPTEGQPTT